MRVFKEDWQLSQFWYDEETANNLAQALLEGANENTVIAILSAPSVYVAISKMSPSCVPTKHIYLFEYDKRFEVLAGLEHFCFYDYTNPLEFPASLDGKVHRILIDPPFLNKPCQTKCKLQLQVLHLTSVLTFHQVGVTANKLLAKANDCGEQERRIMISTGERMAEVVSETYPGTRKTTFTPSHANGLSNEFECYANFEWRGWKFK